MRKENYFLLLASVILLATSQFCVRAETRLGKKDGASDFCKEIVLKMDYPCVNYTPPRRDAKLRNPVWWVTTEDGYLLGLYRIPYGYNEKATNGSWSRPPVYLQHGLVQGGDNWVLNSPDESLGYILADAGFDVWIGNIRGTRWSYGHLNLRREDKDYWDWSWDELAAYDLPAMLEFVVKSTGRKVYYVGHSQGTIMGMAAFTQNKVGSFLAGAALLSPITYLDHINCAFLTVAAHYYIEKMVKTMGVHEFNLRNELGVELVDRVCASPRVDCGNLLAAITGPNCCFNESRIPFYLQYEPHSTSLKNLAHLAQMIRRGTFAKYDYGTFGNLLHYYSFSPPAYNLAQIPTSLPVWMAWGGNDALADPVDVAHTISEMPSQPELVYVENYGHIDFVLSTRANRDIYDSMIAFFRCHEGTLHAQE